MWCVFASKRIFPAVSEQIRRSTERFCTLGKAPLTHCVSAVNSRSVSCVSAAFGPILELTQEIGPFWQPLPAGTAHSSPGTFCSTHKQAQTCVCLYTQAKKQGEHTQSCFFFTLSLLPVFAHRSVFFFLLNELKRGSSLAALLHYKSQTEGRQGSFNSTSLLETCSRVQI